MTELYLIRHGQTLDNVRHCYGGWRDGGLTEEGVAEIIRFKEEGLYDGIDPDYFLSSDLKRATETAELLFPEQSFLQSPAFREMGFGEFEGLTYEELKDDERYQQWIGDEEGNYVTPGGESNRGFTKRVLYGFKRLRELEGSVVLVCHGGVVYEIMHHLFPEENKTMFEWQPQNGRGYRVCLNTLTYEVI
jgi:alpha-ribazole phosphatase